MHKNVRKEIRGKYFWISVNFLSLFDKSCRGNLCCEFGPGWTCPQIPAGMVFQLSCYWKADKHHQKWCSWATAEKSDKKGNLMGISSKYSTKLVWPKVWTDPCTDFVCSSSLRSLRLYQPTHRTLSTVDTQDPSTPRKKEDIIRCLLFHTFFLYPSVFFEVL